MPLPQNIWNNENLVKVLKGGGVAVMPTDTLYGIVGKALDVSVVSRIYVIRKRDINKPCIILIGKINELEKFKIFITEAQKNEIESFKEPTSFILNCPDEKFSYLHCGSKTLAFRLPAQIGLQNLLKETGPLIAPSANLEGLPPAQNITEAKKYFGTLVDLYIDGGEIKGKASKIIKLHKDGSVTVIRS
ncbi:MAG: L-threonylcarbamoyladenylate synthase [Candidatus Berkelbacteria bacterium]|nr:L-threonylcarbamoyladenylate synthase [Candidatus Berkelbacteria bacterium]